MFYDSITANVLQKIACLHDRWSPRALALNPCARRFFKIRPDLNGLYISQRRSSTSQARAEDEFDLRPLFIHQCMPLALSQNIGAVQNRALKRGIQSNLSSQIEE